MAQLREALSARDLNATGLRAALVHRLDAALNKEAEKLKGNEISVAEIKRSKPPAVVKAALQLRESSRKDTRLLRAEKKPTAAGKEKKDSKYKEGGASEPPSNSPFALKTFQARRDGRSFKESRLMSAKKYADESTVCKDAHVSQDGVFDLDWELGQEEFSKKPDSDVSYDDDEDDHNYPSKWGDEEDDDNTCETKSLKAELSKFKTHEERRKSYGNKSAPVNIVMNKTAPTTRDNSRKSLRQYMNTISERWDDIHLFADLFECIFFFSRCFYVLGAQAV